MIRDFSFKIDVSNDMVKTISTPKITGKLIAILLKANKYFYSIKISLKEIPEVSIFEDRTIKNDGYFLLKTDSWNENRQTYDTADFYVLNDELDILIKGMKQTKVEIILRVEDGMVELKKEPEVVPLGN